ncbi:MAG TPA: response regulator transcription factor [Acetobacteraceae bacterium]|nr:response regulator transcription factor [Acetobacteraceae bacterium]
MPSDVSTGAANAAAHIYASEPRGGGDAATHLRITRGLAERAMSPHVLVADDDSAWRTALCRYLGVNGFDSTECSDFASLAEIVQSHAGLFVVVAELTVGSRHLFDCLADFAHQPSAAVLVLSGQNDDTETIVALELGADDVIRKGTDRREIVARIRAAARRLNTQALSRQRPTGAPTASNSQQPACWHFLPDKRELTDPDGRPIMLTLLEFRMLETFVANTGRPLHRRDLFSTVLGRPYEASDRSIDNLVARLRRKLGDPAKRARIIKTARPIGYVFTGFNSSSRNY